MAAAAQLSGVAGTTQWRVTPAAGDVFLLEVRGEAESTWRSDGTFPTSDEAVEWAREHYGLSVPDVQDRWKVRIRNGAIGLFFVLTLWGLLTLVVTPDDEVNPT